MLTLENSPVKVRAVDPRRENHGNTEVLAVDLSFEFKTANKSLEELAPGMLGAFYAPDTSPQTELEEVEGLLPIVRFPKLKPSPNGWVWNESWAHQRLRVHLGGPDFDLVFGDCTVDKLTLSTQDGGTVAYHFRVITHPNPQQYAALLALVTGKNVFLTIDDDPDFAEAAEPDLATPEDWPFPPSGEAAEGGAQ